MDESLCPLETRITVRFSQYIDAKSIFTTVLEKDVRYSKMVFHSAVGHTFMFKLIPIAGFLIKAKPVSFINQLNL